ncbi:hypothetical protein [Chroococcidiopsis sp.]|uniref:hypothetical protein n=1 Tax=Chroococcidiopsis sp. TaxID=3088168 RepID=UPI003F2C9628
MNRGYRFSSSVALANYYSDVRNVANFGIRSSLKGAYGSAMGAVDDMAMKIGQKATGMKQGWNPFAKEGASYGDGIYNKAKRSGMRNAMQNPEYSNITMGAGRSLADQKTAALLRRQAIAQGRAVGNQALTQTQRNIGRGALGVGAAAGLAGLGAAGYAGYRALNPEQEM